MLTSICSQPSTVSLVSFDSPSTCASSVEETTADHDNFTCLQARLENLWEESVALDAYIAELRLRKKDLKTLLGTMKEERKAQPETVKQSVTKKNRSSKSVMKRKIRSSPLRSFPKRRMTLVRSRIF